MKPRWIILGLFLAGIVFGTIIWWPEQPMWKTNLSRFSDLLAFSEDSKSIYVLNDKRSDGRSPTDAHFSCWDALTGKLLNETSISVPDNLGRDTLSHGIFHVEYELTSDGTALIASGKVIHERGPDSCVFYVIETASGQKRFGPVDCSESSRGNAIFSKDGRLIVYYFPLDPFHDDGIEVIDSKSAKRILRVGNVENESIKDIRFSPDASSIALLVGNFQVRWPGDFSIRVYDLTSGNERARIPLHYRDWQRLRSWEGHEITALARVSDPNKMERITKAFSFDLESVPVGQETERADLERRMNEISMNKPTRLQTSWQERDHGTGWKAEGRFGDPEPVWFWKYWNKCAEWLGAKKDDELTDLYRLRFLDADSGGVRYQSPVLSDTSLKIAPDGKSFAALSFRGELSTWNANPFPRWPWALAAGVGALLLILLFGRWRTKRSIRPFPSASPRVTLKA